MQLPSFQWFCCFLALMRMWGKIDLNVTFDSCVSSTSIICCATSAGLSVPSVTIETASALGSSACGPRLTLHCRGAHWDHL